MKTKEIKFRAYSKKLGLVPSDRLGIEFDFGKPFSIWDRWRESEDGEGYEGTLNFTLEQFTGLYDKNGNEIYEGDIIRFPNKLSWYGGTFPEWWSMTKKEKIAWLDKQPYYSFSVKYDINDGYGISKSEALNWEVIGNIHEEAKE